MGLIQQLATWTAAGCGWTGSALNTRGEHTGAIVNRANIGQFTDDLAVFWNTDHPDNPIS